MNPAFTDLASEEGEEKEISTQMRKQAARQMDVSKDLIKRSWEQDSDPTPKPNVTNHTIPDLNQPRGQPTCSLITACVPASQKAYTTSGTNRQLQVWSPCGRREPSRGWARLLSCPTPEHMIWVTAGARRREQIRRIHFIFNIKMLKMIEITFFFF